LTYIDKNIYIENTKTFCPGRAVMKKITWFVTYYSVVAVTIVAAMAIVRSI